MAIRDDFLPGEILAASDLNDTFAAKPTKTVGTTEPVSPVAGDLFYDTNTTPPTAKFYDGTAFQPFSAGPADFSDAATGTYTDGGVDYKYITYNSSGTLTVTQAGFADVLVIGGGGGGAGPTGATAQCGGGAGGFTREYVQLPVGSHTVTVGAGGSGASAGNAGNGNASGIATLVRIGGGGGATAGTSNNKNGFGGGGSPGGMAVVNVSGAFDQVGGGAGGTLFGSGDRDGRIDQIDGNTVTYAEGGEATVTLAGAANSGDGGSRNAAGGSGVVIVRVRT